MKVDRDKAHLSEMIPPLNDAKETSSGPLDVTVIESPPIELTRCPSHQTLGVQPA